ncbi:MAG: hypothetical protein U0176_11125 [Bacteroidia bacterium]
MKTGHPAAYRDSMVALATRVNPDSTGIAYSDAKLSPLTNKPYETEASEMPTYASSNNSVSVDGQRWSITRSAAA